MLRQKHTTIHWCFSLSADTRLNSNCFVMFGRTSFGRADRFSRLHACAHTYVTAPPPPPPHDCRLRSERNFGQPLTYSPSVLAELVVMNGASDVPPICAHRVRQASIIALFLAARTHSQFVPNIVLQAEHTPLHQSVLHLSDDWGGGGGGTERVQNDCASLFLRADIHHQRSEKHLLWIILQ